MIQPEKSKIHKIERFKIGVDKRVLLFLAGLMWICVGVMLLGLAYSWLSDLHDHRAFPFTAVGIIAALLIHHLGFLRIVDKNLGRILPMEGKRCVFAFVSFKSYILIAVMVLMGVILRRSHIPRQFLSSLYIGIGLALVLSSVRYIRVLVNQVFMRKQN
jgi:hypothetical protein